jgi:hypothetical protein
MCCNCPGEHAATRCPASPHAATAGFSSCPEPPCHAPHAPLLALWRRLLEEDDVEGFAGLPLFLAGISLGGCIALNAALQTVRL